MRISRWNSWNLLQYSLLKSFISQFFYSCSISSTNSALRTPYSLLCCCPFYNRRNSLSLTWSRSRIRHLELFPTFWCPFYSFGHHSDCTYRASGLCFRAIVHIPVLVLQLIGSSFWLCLGTWLSELLSTFWCSFYSLFGCHLRPIYRAFSSSTKDWFPEVLATFQG